MRLPAPETLTSDEQRQLYAHDVAEFHAVDEGSHARLFYFSRFRACAEALCRLTPPGPVADIGCAQGNLALHLAEQGRRVVAVDLRFTFLDYMRKKQENGIVWPVVADASYLPLQPRFAAVILLEVVEHMAFPEDAIRQIAEILIPGGILCLTTPNGDRLHTGMPTFSSIADRSALVARQFEPDAEGHLFYFTGGELKKLVEGLGLDVLEHQYYGTPWLTGRLLGRLVTRFLPVPVLTALDRLTRSSNLVASRVAEGQMVIARRSEKA